MSITYVSTYFVVDDDGHVEVRASRQSVLPIAVSINDDRECIGRVYLSLGKARELRDALVAADLSDAAVKV